MAIAVFMIRSSRARVSTRGESESCGSHKQFFDRHFERGLPAIELGDQQIGVLVFLRANFAHGSAEPLRNAAHRQTLTAPRRTELMKFSRMKLDGRWSGRFRAAHHTAAILFLSFHRCTTCGFRFRDESPKAEKSAPPLYRLLEKSPVRLSALRPAAQPSLVSVQSQ